jgi:hypothetical protein
MIEKRASVVEIHKNYCIAVTGDGQFLKQAAPAGTYEIGDSITLVAEKENDRAAEKFDIYRIVSRVAAGFAIVAVVAFGSYFGIHILRSGKSAMTVALNESVTEETVQASLAQTADESEIAAAQENSLLSKKQSGEVQLLQESNVEENEDNLLEKAPEGGEQTQPGSAAPILYEGLYNISGTGEVVLIDYDDIMIDYSIEESKTESGGSDFEKSLLFNFIQNKKDHFFNGNIDTILNDTNKSAIRTVPLLFENFEYGAKRTEEVALENDEKSFTLVIYGSFN